MLRGKHVYYINADHLGTPRVIVNRANNVIWRWDSDPFGNASSRQEDGDDEGDHDESESDDSEFTYNLRFPGQYFDKETGLHYNYFRDYDPRVGRYVQSDPIGLEGGLNTYAYVNGDPVNLADPDGLRALVAVRPIPLALPRPLAVPSVRPPPVSPWWLLIYPRPAGQGSDIVPVFESRSIPVPVRPKCGCTCTCRADADDRIPGNVKLGLPRFAFGTATAGNCAEASKEAKRIATRNLGMQPKHIPCRCIE